MHGKVQESISRVLDVNSDFKIKNPNFIVSFKNMTKLVRCRVGGNDRRCEQRPLAKFKGRRSQCRLFNLKNSQWPAL